MNRPVHFEIHATDPAKLSKFYADVFGWLRHQWRLRQALGRGRGGRRAGQCVRVRWA